MGGDRTHPEHERPALDGAGRLHRSRPEPRRGAEAGEGHTQRRGQGGAVSGAFARRDLESAHSAGCGRGGEAIGDERQPRPRSCGQEGAGRGRRHPQHLRFDRNARAAGNACDRRRQRPGRDQGGARRTRHQHRTRRRDDAGDGRLRHHEPHAPAAEVQESADRRSDGQGHEGRQRKVHRSRGVGLHRQAGQQRTPSLHAPCLVDRLSAMRARATSPGPDERSLEEIELQLLLEGIALHYGYDFRDYAPAPLRRNILISMALEGVPTISAYQDRVLHDPASLQRFLNTVGVNVTSMFREAIAMRVLREEIVPWLRTFPSVRIWVAGCATGEEVASLAIVLRETEMLGRTRIYATDINEASLTIAARGLMPIESVQSGEAGYRRSGGRGALTDYYTVDGGIARLDSTLLPGVSWARHNLVSGASFNDFHVILCT